MPNDYRNSAGGSFVQRMDGTVATQSSLHAERHYAVAEIAEMWNLSVDKIRELFADEPGVLVIGERRPFRRRPYLHCVFHSRSWNVFTRGCPAVSVSGKIDASVLAI
jgi:hypothetical protein